MPLGDGSTPSRRHRSMPAPGLVRKRVVLAEPQGRQEESGAEDVAETGLALDGGALGLEGGDVAVKGAQRNAELLDQIGAPDRMPPSAQGLE